MPNTYRIGVIGFAHMHINHVLALFAAHPQTELVACADTPPLIPELRAGQYTRAWNLRHALNDLGMPKAYDDYQKMLEQETFDIVICCAENAQHPAVVAACAEKGVHVMIEKPMASSLNDGLRMARAARAAGIELIVNWPITWQPASHTTKELIDAGAIGRVLTVKWRGGHLGPLGAGVSHPRGDQSARQKGRSGPTKEQSMGSETAGEFLQKLNGIERGATWWHQRAAGGGAMLDYCCYGSLVARWLVGEPATAAMGMRANLNSKWGDAEDNAAMIIRFPQAMALCEASWTTLDHGVSPGPIVYGAEGTLVVDKETGDQSPNVRVERGGGRTEYQACEPLPAGRMNIAQEFIHRLQTGDPLHQTLELEFNLEVMAILDAGLRSANSGRLELVDTDAWRLE